MMANPAVSHQLRIFLREWMACCRDLTPVTFFSLGSDTPATRASQCSWQMRSSSVPRSLPLLVHIPDRESSAPLGRGVRVKDGFPQTQFCLYQHLEGAELSVRKVSAPAVANSTWPGVSPWVSQLRKCILAGLHQAHPLPAAMWWFERGLWETSHSPW